MVRSPALRHGPSLKDQVSPEEWEARVDLAACYRLVHHHGLSDMVYNHISVRLEGSETFLLNPYGLLYSEVTASNLVKVDLDGNEITPSNTGYAINPAGFVIHSAIHQGRPDVKCVLHTHSAAGVAVSALKEGLLPLSQFAMRFHGRVSYHDYEGPAVDLDERKRLIEDMGGNNVMILRNHGLLFAYPTIAEAFNALYWFERACEVQLAAMACNAELNLPAPEVVEKTAHLYDPRVRRAYGVMEWPTMLRMLDELDPSYRN